MMRKIILLLSMFFVTITALGQIKGTVKDSSNNEPLEFVNVVLLSSADSAFIAGSTTDNLGGFVINNTSKQGILRVSSVGYKTKIVNISDTINTILLERDSHLLEEVTVKGKKYVHTSEGLTVNILGTTYSKLGYASDVLKHLPFVTQKNGDFTVFGRGTPIIYINNRQIMNNEELAQLNSSDIKQVKIITSPGAEYSATTNAVIRIVTTKRGKTFGGLFDYGLSQERRTSHWGGLSMNLGMGDFDFFASLRYNRAMSLIEQTSDLSYNNNASYETLEMKDKNLSLKGVMGINMQHNEKLSLGIRYQYTRVPQNSDKTMDSLAFYENKNLKNMITSMDNRKKNSYTHYVNSYASYYFAKETYLKFDADYLNIESNSTQDYIVMSNEALFTKSWTRNNLYAGRMIFSATLFGGIVKTGVELSYTVNKNSYKVLDASTIQNELQTTWNTAKQHGQSAFLQYGHDWGEHWSANIGVRFENVVFKYYVDGERSDVSCNYGNLYPSASISYDTDNVQLTLAYRASTQRPSYFMLRSAIEYNNPYYYEGGTPNLKSQNKNTLSLSMSWKDLQLIADYSHVKNGTFYVLDMYNKSDSIVLFHTKNIDNIDVFNIGAVYSPTWFRLWSPTFSITMTKPHITYGEQKYNKPIFYFEFNNILELPHNILLGCDMNYNTAGNYDTDLMYQVADFGFDAYCIKTFLKDRLRIKLSLSNAFNTSREKWSKSTNGINLNKWCDGGRRTFAITISYRINKIENKYKGEHSTEEIYRL